jgi:hypothetical protein
MNSRRRVSERWHEYSILECFGSNALAGAVHVVPSPRVARRVQRATMEQPTRLTCRPASPDGLLTGAGLVVAAVRQQSPATGDQRRPRPRSGSRSLQCHFRFKTKVNPHQKSSLTRPDFRLKLIFGEHRKSSHTEAPATPRATTCGRPLDAGAPLAPSRADRAPVDAARWQTYARRASSRRDGHA